MSTFKQLHHFLVLAKELHFAKASQKLGITQAALSCDIKKMEQSLGFALFDRSNKWQITLTAAGKNYLNKVRNIPEILDNARLDSSEIARGEAGVLSIAVCSFVYSRFNFGEVCKKMHRTYPKIKLQISDMQRSPQVAEHIRQGRADVGFFMVHDLEQQTDGLSFKKLLQINMMLAVPAGDPLAEKEKLTIGDLKNSCFILPSREEIPLIRQYMDSLFLEKFGHLPTVNLEAVGFQGIAQLVSAGLGVGFLPYSSGEQLPEDVVLKELPFALQRNLIAAWSEDNHSTAVTNFISVLENM